MSKPTINLPPELDVTFNKLNYYFNNFDYYYAHPLGELALVVTQPGYVPKDNKWWQEVELVIGGNFSKSVNNDVTEVHLMHPAMTSDFYFLAADHFNVSDYLMLVDKETGICLYMYPGIGGFINSSVCRIGAAEYRIPSLVGQIITYLGIIHQNIKDKRKFSRKWWQWIQFLLSKVDPIELEAEYLRNKTSYDVEYEKVGDWLESSKVLLKENTHLLVDKSWQAHQKFSGVDTAFSFDGWYKFESIFTENQSVYERVIKRIETSTTEAYPKPTIRSLLDQVATKLNTQTLNSLNPPATIEEIRQYQKSNFNITYHIRELFLWHNGQQLATTWIDGWRLLSLEEIKEIVSHQPEVSCELIEGTKIDLSDVCPFAQKENTLLCIDVPSWKIVAFDSKTNAMQTVAASLEAWLKMATY
jgi:hypothetical protein